MPDIEALPRKERFKAWQDENRWLWEITSRTLPTPPSPHVVVFGRDNVTLEWHAPFVPHENDDTEVGYLIHWYPDDDQRVHDFEVFDSLMEEDQGGEDVHDEYDEDLDEDESGMCLVVVLSCGCLGLWLFWLVVVVA